ncbi:MAG: right-handed parallel beta-helix repeat-containing protein, partial [Methanobacteriaceae archaeon]|nr:right-handed parallel beta-helix repeat-containing protein [Methanobacteriaceae archaeon]
MTSKNSKVDKWIPICVVLIMTMVCALAMGSAFAADTPSTTDGNLGDTNTNLATSVNAVSDSGNSSISEIATTSDVANQTSDNSNSQNTTILSATNPTYSDTVLATDNGNNVYVNGSSKTNGNGSNDNPYNNLNDAINIAADGSTIIIASGTYKVVSNDTIFRIKKNLTLMGADDSTVTLSGNGKWNIVTTDASNINVVLKNLILDNGYARNGGALVVNAYENTYVTVINCTFTNNRAKWNGGAICNRANLEIINSTFTNNKGNTDNKASYGGGAVASEAGSTITITNSIFKENSANKNGGAIFTEGNTNIINSNFTSNTADNGIVYAQNANTLNIADSTFTKNTCSNGVIYSLNTKDDINDVTIADNKGIGININGGSATINDVTITNSTLNAINITGGETSINNANILSIANGISLTGVNGANITNSNIVSKYFGVYVTGTNSNIKIDNNNISTTYSSNSDGIKIYAYGNDVIHDILISNNNYNIKGYSIGLYIITYKPGNIYNVIIDNETVSHTKHEGIYLVGVNNYQISNSTITSNGMNSEFSALELQNCKYGEIINNNISDNTGRGIYLYNSDNTNILRNTITNNGYYGVYIYGSNNNNVNNNRIYNNKYGGVIVDGGVNNNGDSNWWGNNTITKNDYNSDLTVNDYYTVNITNINGIYTPVFSLNGTSTDTGFSKDFTLVAKNESGDSASGKASGMEKSALPLGNVYFMLDGWTSALIVTDAEEAKDDNLDHSTYTDDGDASVVGPVATDTVETGETTTTTTTTTDTTGT